MSAQQALVSRQNCPVELIGGAQSPVDARTLSLRAWSRLRFYVRASARSSFLDCTDDPPASRLGSAASIKPKCFSLNVHRATSSGPQDHSLQGLGAGPFCEDRPIQLMSEHMLRGRGCRSTFPMLQVGSDGRTAGHGRPQDRAVATVVWLGPLSSPCRDHPSAGTQSTPPCTCGPADLTDTQPSG